MADQRSNRIPNDDLMHLAKREEPRLLSILLKDRDALSDCLSLNVSTDHFWFDDNRFLFKVIKENHEKFHSLLTRSAMDSFMDMQSSYTDEQRAARKMYWDEVNARESTSEDYEMLKHNINGRFVQQQAYNILKDNIEKIVGATAKQVDLVKDVRKSFLAIDGIDSDPYALTMSIEDGLEKVMAHIEERREHPELQAGILIGVKVLDEIFYGLVKGSYTIVSGMTNGGKTTLMFNMAFNMARAGYSVVYVSMEKEAVPFYARLLALHAMVDYNRIKRGGKDAGGIPDHIFDLFKMAKVDLDENIKPKLECIQLTQQTTLSQIIVEIDKVKARKKVDVIFVDYLGVIGFETKHPTRPDIDLAIVSQRLQAYGRMNKFVTVTAVQIKAASTKEIRKKSEKVGDDGDITTIEVNPEDLSGSQMVINDADNSMGVVLNSDKPPTKMFVHITKARDNEKGKTISLDFDGRLGRVADPEMSPGNIQAVDDLLYNNDITEQQLASEDDLFKAIEAVNEEEEAAPLPKMSDDQSEDQLEGQDLSSDEFDPDWTL